MQGSFLNIFEIYSLRVFNCNLYEPEKGSKSESLDEFFAV